MLSKNEKILLGKCLEISKTRNVDVKDVRLFFIVTTPLWLFGIGTYVVYSIIGKELSDKIIDIFWPLIVNISKLFYKIINTKAILFSIIGAIIGFPLSYYLQSEVVRYAYPSLLKYIEKCDNWDDDLYFTCLLGIILTSAILGYIGYLQDKKK